MMNEIYLENPTDKDFAELEGKQIVSVKTNGNNSAITDAALESLSKVVGLESIDLEWATNITDNGISNLSVLTSLKYIDLSFCSNVTDTGVSSLKSSIKGVTIEQ